MQQRGGKRNVKQAVLRPVEAAVLAWINEHVTDPERFTYDGHLFEKLVAEAPKRWIVYEPMVLLPSGSFSSSLWQTAILRTDSEHVNSLWRKILEQIAQRTGSAGKLTHLAVNEAIPRAVTGSQASFAGDEVNRLRSPVDLKFLYGDFGPREIMDADGVANQYDFSRAFWTSTKQNGIAQTWAPRWTMFSRGNIKEKARLLAFHERQGAAGVSETIKLRRQQHRSQISGKWAVDLYAGIGYFVFSYVRMGLRVLGWELNPWSIEGLRRGALANGWSVAVFQQSDDNAAVIEVLKQGAQIIVFQEDNLHAEARVRQMWASGVTLDIMHINCGLLPSSKDIWTAALTITNGHDAWLHLHENVAVEDIEHRRREIFNSLQSDLSTSIGNMDRGLDIEHVEKVKTFAPGVWHCVFDVYSTSNS
jgi:tRNA wybutosine-synthesizing protein 2